MYDFNTAAGGEVFYDLFERYLDALLYPDYTDEEIGREVCNWGITQNPDSTLRLEEKGSVYNEMSTTMNNPYALLYDSIGRLLYGNAHPISYNAGDSVYQKILPGYGMPSKDVKGAINFVIGSEKQMKAYEVYLKSAEGENTVLYRLYPRDYWMTDIE